MKKFLLLIIPITLLLTAALITYSGGKHQGPGEITATPLPDTAVTERAERQADAAQTTQIVFGDLHVHTTFSADAFLRSLPLAGGSGTHPPADACDYARFCSGLDFFALTDHAESLSPRHWEESVETIRQCNDVAGDPSNPDLVAYMGWEWTNVGLTADEHYGHRNVILRGLGDDDIPPRPIAAPSPLEQAASNLGVSQLQMAAIPIRDFPNRQRYMEFRHYMQELLRVDRCPEDVPTTELPEDCMEFANTPGDLFARLEAWDLDAIVIPHGTTWGFYTPPGYTWDKALEEENRGPVIEPLIEVMSGHGNSEEYRDWVAIEIADDGTRTCPAPTDDYEPCCWTAGEIIRERCEDEGGSDCEERAQQARDNYVEAEAAGHLTVPGATLEDWGTCGQCLDCWLPSFMYRPGGSVQYILARGNFDDPERPYHARYGFIASSDNHSARPGTGFKEMLRMDFADPAGPPEERWANLIYGPPEEPVAFSRPFSPEDPDDIAPFRVAHLERQSPFFLTGGLVAVHTTGRDRDSIWDALERRQVYGTSGGRILLWFDLMNSPGGPAPMGAEVSMGEAPRFAVSALGAFEQQDGCPDWLVDTIGAERVDELCLGECHNPGDTRNVIDRIEVVRIQPQLSEDEPLGSLIQDPWMVLDCPGDPAGCEVEFEDPEFVAGARGTVYYVRAIEEATPTVNAEVLGCEEFPCESLDPCYGDYRGDRSDDCTAPSEERAWSSPIYVDFDPSLVPPPPALPVEGSGSPIPSEGSGQVGP